MSNERKKKRYFLPKQTLTCKWKAGMCQGGKASPPLLEPSFSLKLGLKLVIYHTCKICCWCWCFLEMTCFLLYITWMRVACYFCMDESFTLSSVSNLTRSRKWKLIKMGVHTLIHKITHQGTKTEVGDCVYLPGEVWLCQHARGDNHILSNPSTNSHTKQLCF